MREYGHRQGRIKREGGGLSQGRIHEGIPTPRIPRLGCIQISKEINNYVNVCTNYYSCRPYCLTAGTLLQPGPLHLLHLNGNISCMK